MLLLPLLVQVLMAKASHCRPCKKFASTYHAFAAQFSDCQLLEIVGDESKETRKMMVRGKLLCWLRGAAHVPG